MAGDASDCFLCLRMAAGGGKLQSGGGKRKPDILEEIKALLVEQARKTGAHLWPKQAV